MPNGRVSPASAAAVASEAMPTYRPPSHAPGSKSGTASSSSFRSHIFRYQFMNAAASGPQQQQQQQPAGTAAAAAPGLHKIGRGNSASSGDFPGASMLFQSRGDKGATRSRRPQSAALQPPTGPSWSAKHRASTTISAGAEATEQQQSQQRSQQQQQQPMVSSRYPSSPRTRGNARVHNYRMPSPPPRSSARPSSNNVFNRLSMSKAAQHQAQGHRGETAATARHSRTSLDSSVGRHHHHHHNHHPVQSFVKAVNRWTTATPATPPPPTTPAHKDRRDKGSYDEETGAEQRARRRRQTQWVRSASGSTECPLTPRRDSYHTRAPTYGTHSHHHSRRPFRQESASPSPQTLDSSGIGWHATKSSACALKGYTMGDVVGQGGFCVVRLAVHTATGGRVAVKVYDKVNMSSGNKLLSNGDADMRRVQREVQVLRRVAAHPSVIQLFEVIECQSHLYLVMEFASAGSLLDHVRANKRLSESEARRFLAQTAIGLEYCHSRRVVHRDIKLENLLLDDRRNIKIIDFGLAALLTPISDATKGSTGGPSIVKLDDPYEGSRVDGENKYKKLKVFCGSPSYAAPEIIGRRPYDGPPVDVWSLGVVLFAMVAGHLPFYSRAGNKQELAHKILRGTFSCPGALSADCMDLLHGMLDVNPARRLSCAQVRRHRWARAQDDPLCPPTPPPPPRSPPSSKHSSAATAAQAKTEQSTSPSSTLSLYAKSHPQKITDYEGDYSRGGGGEAAVAEVGERAIDKNALARLSQYGFNAKNTLRQLRRGEHTYATTAYELLKSKEKTSVAAAAATVSSASGVQ